MITSVFVSPLPIAAVLGMLVGAASMLVYWAASPQARLAEVGARLAQSRQQLSQADQNDFRVVWAHSQRALGLSLQQLRLTIVPTALALVPVIGVAWAIEHWFDLSAYSLGDFGPAWLLSGHTAFWMPLCLAAVAVKLRFKIK